MGYRSAFLNNAGAVAVHSEVFLHAMDREIAPRAMSVLVAGVGNGGVVEVWREALPEGSMVTAIDPDPEAESLLGVGVVCCDVESKSDLLRVLGRVHFDVIVDSTGTLTPFLWPFLREGGLMIYENIPDVDAFADLARAVMLERPSDVLPVEEVMRVNVYGPVVSVEKRAPKVVPYLDILTGNFADLIPESYLISQGVKRAIVGG